MILKLGNQHLFCILSSNLSPLFFDANPQKQQPVPFDPRNILLISCHLFHPDPFNLLAHWNDTILYHQASSVVSTGLLDSLLLLESLSFSLLLGALFLLF